MKKGHDLPFEAQILGALGLRACVNLRRQRAPESVLGIHRLLGHFSHGEMTRLSCLGKDGRTFGNRLIRYFLAGAQIRPTERLVRMRTPACSA